MTRRRPGDGNALLRGDVAVALALMAVAAAGIGKGLLPGRTVLPLDNLGVFLPWQGTLGPPANPLLGDPVQQFSSRLFVAEALRAARLPLWNPHVMAGHPLAGDVQAEVFNPILWLLAATLSPLRGFTAQVALQLWLAGLFMYVWMRVLVGDRFASLGAALVWMLAGYQQVWMAYPWRMGTLMWLPAVAAAWEHAVGRDRLWPAVLGGLAAAMVVLGGQTQFALFGAVCLSVYGLGRLGGMHAARRRRGLVFAAAIAGLGASIGAIALVPAMEQAADTIRAPFSVEALRDSAVPAGQLITVVAPWFLGDPRAGDYRGAQNANEMALYIGILPLILVLAGAYARRDSKARWAALLAVTVAMMALGSPAAWVLARIPGANMFGLMRWLGVWPLAAALMVGLGLSAPELGGATRRRFVHAAAAAAASLVAILVAAALVVEGAAGGVVAPLGLLGLSIAALVYWVHHHEGRAAQAAVLTVIAADLLLFGHGYTPSAATADAFPLVPPLDWLTAQRRASEFRIAAYQGDRLVLVPAVAPSVGLDDVGGYSSSARRSYRDFVGRLTVPSGNRLVDFNANMVTFGDAKLVLLQMLNVGYVLSADVLRPEEQSIVPLAACTQVRRLVRDERVSRPLHVGTNGLNRVDVRVQSRGAVALHLVSTEDPSVHIAYAVLGEEQGSIRTMYFAPVADSGGRDFLVYADLPADYDGPEPDVCVADGQLAIGAWARHDPALQQVRFANGTRVYEVPDRPGRAWMVADGRVVEGQQVALELVAADGFDIRRTVAVEVPSDDMGALPGSRCAAPGGQTTVSVADDGPNVRLVTLKPPACGWLVLSEAHAPGWTAEADGAPARVYRADGGIQAVPLPAPTGHVVVRYRPRSVLAGGAIAAAGLMMAVLLIVTDLWRRSSPPGRR